MAIDLQLSPKQKRPAGEPCCEPGRLPGRRARDGRAHGRGREGAGRSDPPPAGRRAAKARRQGVRLRADAAVRRQPADRLPPPQGAARGRPGRLGAPRACGPTTTSCPRPSPSSAPGSTGPRMRGAPDEPADPSDGHPRERARALRGGGRRRRPRARSRASSAAAARAGAAPPARPSSAAGLYERGRPGRAARDRRCSRASGCGNPTAVAELREGEVVLDLGSGGGIDVLLSARRVGPTGKAYGLDMTEEMLALARRNAAEAGATNVEFLKGRIEEIPLPAETVDVVISNCVVNLSPDKEAVLAETFRVLRPGGRLGHQRRRRRGPPDARPSAPSAATGPAASPAPCRWASTGRLLDGAGFADVDRRVHPRGGRRPARRDRVGRQAGRRAEPPRGGGRPGGTPRLLLSARSAPAAIAGGRLAPGSRGAVRPRAR